MKRQGKIYSAHGMNMYIFSSSFKAQPQNWISQEC